MTGGMGGRVTIAWLIVATSGYPSTQQNTTTATPIEQSYHLFIKNTMEVAASIVGLLAAGANIAKTLDHLISTFIDAPSVARTTCNEIRDFRYALTKLQPYVHSAVSTTLLGASVLDIHHLSLTLATSVFTFSMLEKKLDRLVGGRGLLVDPAGPRRMDVLSRLKWLRDEAGINQLVQNVQQHKSSLNLLLTVLIRSVSKKRVNLRCLLMLILRSENLTEADQGRVHLENGLAEIMSRLSGQSQLTPPVQMDLSPTTTESDTSSVSTVSSLSSRVFRHGFEPTLFSSRPYRTITNSSAMSLASSRRRGTRWSLYSGGSNTSVFSLPITIFEPSGQTLADANMPQIPLPINCDAVYNTWWYNNNQLTTESLAINVPDRISTLLSPGDSKRELILCEAARTGDTAVVLQMLALGVDFEARSVEQETALTHATRNNQEVIVRILLKAGANINSVSGDDHTPLVYAVLGGHEELVAMFLDQGALCNLRGRIHGTPLYCAVQLGHRGIIRRLLNAGASPTMVAIQGESSLDLSVKSGDNSLWELLLGGGEYSLQPNLYLYEALKSAVTYRRLATVEMLLDRILLDEVNTRSWINTSSWPLLLISHVMW